MEFEFVIGEQRNQSHWTPLSTKKLESKLSFALAQIRLSIYPDTNWWLAHLPLISNLYSRLPMNARIIIPFVVVQELDGLKKNKDDSQVAEAATRANSWIAQSLKDHQRLTRLVVQPRPSAAILSNSSLSNDDEILDCCLDYLRKGGGTGRALVLFSNDKNLGIKAHSLQIPCLSHSPAFSSNFHTFIETISKISNHRPVVLMDVEESNSMAANDQKLDQFCNSMIVDVDNQYHQHRRQSDVDMQDSGGGGARRVDDESFRSRTGKKDQQFTKSLCSYMFDFSLETIDIKCRLAIEATLLLCSITVSSLLIEEYGPVVPDLPPRSALPLSLSQITHLLTSFRRVFETKAAAFSGSRHLFSDSFDPVVSRTDKDKIEFIYPPPSPSVYFSYTSFSSPWPLI